ncbi:MAG: carbamoyltransferase [Lachnotalea sp.]
MYIVGISYSMHDSSICLFCDGKILCAIEEERMDRVKHSENFPYKSIEKILIDYNISINDISYIGLNFMPSMVKKEKLEKFALEGFPNNYMVYFGMKMWYITINESKKILRNKLGYKGKILFVDHHMAHAASAFYSSEFHESLIITSDGTGEKMSLGIWKGNGNRIEKVVSNTYPNSLGLIYTFFTYHIGLGLNGEGKTMGLAPYGEDVYCDFFNEIIQFTDKEIFVLNKKYFNCPQGMLYINKCFTKEAIRVIGEADLSNEITETKKNIAASLQAFLERTMIKIVNEYLCKTGMKKLCLSGGVALNSALNGKLLKCIEDNSLFVQPAPNDSGTSIGVCQYIYYAILNNERTIEEFTPYLGPCYSDIEILKELEYMKCTYRKVENIEKITADLLSKGYIVGWFQGGMEIGPRALGNRSILADPRIENMKECLNLKVKHREPFRPFAPIIKEEDMQQYFELQTKSPYMAIVAEVKKEKQTSIPAVVHVDKTARIQTVTQKQNPKIYKLLDEFGKITNTPVLINTSFNDNNEPIVCSPQDAIRCFLKTEIDYLVLGDYLVEKGEITEINNITKINQEEDVNIKKYRTEYYVKGVLSKFKRVNQNLGDKYYEE